MGDVLGPGGLAEVITLGSGGEQDGLEAMDAFPFVLLEARLLHGHDHAPRNAGGAGSATVTVGEEVNHIQNDGDGALGRHPFGGANELGENDIMFLGKNGALETLDQNRHMKKASLDGKR